MAPISFQFRLCQDPACGLRYPLLSGSAFGERCPICLGATVAVAESHLEREVAPQRGHQAISAANAVLLDNIRSGWNVGSIFRSAEGFGFSQLYLCGITPGAENEQVRKTALGAERAVSWSSHRNAVSLAAELKRGGCSIWSLERTDGSQPIESALVGEPRPRGIVLIVGNEQAGVDPGLLQLSDKIVHIEMSGAKRSFNVAVAFAVAAHVISRG